MEKIYKHFPIKIREVDAEKGVVEAVVSSEEVDRYNEVIRASAYKKRLKNFLKHPVLLSSHKYSDLRSQIGIWEKVWVEDNQLVGRAKYFINVGNDEADWGFFLAKNGVAAYSVGFIPYDYEQNEYDAEDVREGKKPSRIYTDVELLEISQVLVPANPTALQRSIDEGEDEEFLKEYSKEVLDLINKSPNNIRVNSAGISHAKFLINAGKVDKDSDWSFDASDGNSILENGGWDEYKKWFLAIDTNAGEETKAHYKFPFGKNGKVFRKGIIAAKQRAAQQGYDSIEKAASNLLDEIDNKESSNAETKIEVTDEYYHIPVPSEEGKHAGHKIRTIVISDLKGIKGKYCVDDKEIISYMFDKDRWSLDEAWIKEHSKSIDIAAIVGEIIKMENEEEEMDKIYEKLNELERRIDELKAVLLQKKEEEENKTRQKTESTEEIDNYLEQLLHINSMIEKISVQLK